MKNRSLNFPALTEDAVNELLAERRDVLLSSSSPNEDILTYNRIHADAAEYNRRRLVSEYQITLDDFGNYATIGQAHKLLIDGLKAVCTTLGETARHLELYGGTGDDGSDYLNAASDQLSFLANLNAGFDDEQTEKELLHVLNCSDEAAMDDSDAMAFRYGYADHGSPISDLALCNNEDD
jgi:hypothetical protein